MISNIGKKIPLNIPAFILPSASSETNPTSEGPPPQPTSPARARNANMAVPPVGIDLAARLKVPGHMTPTDNPHIAHPISPSTGEGDRDASR